MEQPERLIYFLQTYQRLTKHNLDELANLYTRDVTFIDPAHKINGLETLEAYFTKLYQRVASIQFEYRDTLYQNDMATIYWTMTFVNKSFNRGNPVVVEGNTLIKFDADKVYYHRDYFDLGDMLYEKLPIIGRVIRFVKHKLADV